METNFFKINQEKQKFEMNDTKQNMVSFINFNLYIYCQVSKNYIRNKIRVAGYNPSFFFKT